LGLKEAMQEYEKATKWIDNNQSKVTDEIYDRYLAVIEKCRVVMNENIKSLGYNPYKNYEDLLK